MLTLFSCDNATLCIALLTVYLTAGVRTLIVNINCVNTKTLFSPLTLGYSNSLHIFATIAPPGGVHIFAWLASFRKFAPRACMFLLYYPRTPVKPYYGPYPVRTHMHITVHTPHTYTSRDWVRCRAQRTTGTSYLSSSTSCLSSELARLSTSACV